jgi:hypothetical protein
MIAIATAPRILKPVTRIVHNLQLPVVLEFPKRGVRRAWIGKDEVMMGPIFRESGQLHLVRLRHNRHHAHDGYRES